jgi:dipeptidyl aminopeptidase/acylaminoacyl peptidase
MPVNSSTTIVQDVKGIWKKELSGEVSGFFSAGNRFFIFSGDKTLYFLKLGTGDIEHIDGIESYKRPNAATSPWLCYSLNNNNLTVKNLVSGKEQQFKNVENYFFSPDDERLLLLVRDTIGGQSHQRCKLFNLVKGEMSAIWASSQSNDKFATHSFDRESSSLVFSADENGQNVIWLYTRGMAMAEKMLSDRDIKPAFPGFSINKSAPQFTQNGKYIYFQLQSDRLVLPKPDRKMADVDVWSYTDSILPFEQMNTPPTAIYHVAMEVKERKTKVIKISNPDERFDGISGDYAFVTTHPEINELDYWWPSYKEKGVWLVSLKDNARKKFFSSAHCSRVNYSPNGRYILYFDQKEMGFCSYNIETGKTKHLTTGLPPGWFANSDEKYVYAKTRASYWPVGTAGWIDEDQVLVYDDYDIWQLDLTGEIAPTNLTAGYGRRHHVRLRMEGIWPGDIIGDKMKDPIILSAYNTLTKYSGYFKASLTKKQDPSLLCMGPWSFSDLQKSANADKWVVKKASSTKSSNCFVSSDLKSFSQISSIAPEKSYNWLSSKVVNYQQLDGTSGQGTLYKPENFDPSKKYPIIFYYYEQLTGDTYNFPDPELSSGTVNIPWFVSRGYLVFTPDIHYGVASVTGKVNGDYVVNSVVAAANYMAKQPYIDPNSMGIHGHSFGGGETLYLITHSNVFAAACSVAATVSNEISAYLGGSYSRIHHCEFGHDKIGATLWQRPDLYIRSSPVFRADKVSTPLLLMHNISDGVTNWDQSIQMFMALRRLGKQVWLLQYDRETHVITQTKNQIDFTIRLQQFYDHYLKGTPPPVWMINGRPAYLKGIDGGFELDSTVKTPLPLKTYMPEVPNKKPVTVIFK